MKFKQFQEGTSLTSKYKNPDTNFTYPILGLVGESEEFFETVEVGDIDNIPKEAGDVLFYIARLDLSLGLNLESKFDEIATEVYTHSELEYFDMLSESLLVLKNACKISEQIKKLIRDDNETLTDDRKEIISIRLISIYDNIHVIASMLGSSVTEYQQLNNAKLLDRLNRGVIHGNGNNR